MKRLPQEKVIKKRKVESIGTMISETSFGTNEEICDMLVKMGFFPARLVCESCKAPLKFDLNRK